MTDHKDVFIFWTMEAIRLKLPLFEPHYITLYYLIAVFSLFCSLLWYELTAEIHSVENSCLWFKGPDILNQKTVFRHICVCCVLTTKHQNMRSTPLLELESQKIILHYWSHWMTLSKNVIKNRQLRKQDQAADRIL